MIRTKCDDCIHISFHSDEVGRSYAYCKKDEAYIVNFLDCAKTPCAKKQAVGYLDVDKKPNVSGE